MYAIFAYMYQEFKPNVGKYYMEHLENFIQYIYIYYFSILGILNPEFQGANSKKTFGAQHLLSMVKIQPIHLGDS